MAVEGTGTSGSRWLKTNYPERSTEDPVLRAEENKSITDEALLDNGW